MPLTPMNNLSLDEFINLSALELSLTKVQNEIFASDKTPMWLNNKFLAWLRQTGKNEGHESKFEYCQWPTNQFAVEVCWQD